ncbi:MAG: hypothetical protein J5689_03285 [Clostridia bacterium]|nr:hypothetical protein [Clostridia bacterium]
MKDKEQFYSQKEFEEKLKSELRDKETELSKQRDKIMDLKREIIRLQKEMDIIDAREIEVSAAINKYKSKSSFLENIIKMRLDIEIVRLENVYENVKKECPGFNDSEFVAVLNSLKALRKDATEVEEIAKIKGDSSQNKADSLEERYHKLLAIYEYAMAEAGDKKRGRPKKEADNIETFLKRKKEESDRKKKDSFDFDEALNPTESLDKIMKDLV